MLDLYGLKKKYSNLPSKQRVKEFQYNGNEMSLCNCDGVNFLGCYNYVIIKCPFLALIKKLICDFLSLNASVIVNFCLL